MAQTAGSTAPQERSRHKGRGARAETDAVPPAAGRVRRAAVAEPMAGPEEEADGGTGSDGAGRSSESSLSRLLATLGLFSTARPSLMADEIAAELGVPKSTAYRYIQELTKVGLLVRLDRSITLGPRIIELDRCIRESDPVIRAAVPPMRELAEQTGLDVFLSKLYGHSIITVHTESHDPQPRLRYGRGRPVPVLHGASSKALVAFLPAARLRRLHQELAGESGELPSWEMFYEMAQRIRRDGYCRTSGELNEGRTGVSAPIFGRGRLVVASVTALGSDARMALFKEEAIAELVQRTAHMVSVRLSADGHL